MVSCVQLLCDVQLREYAKDFVVGGTAGESLYGACESMYKPDMVLISGGFDSGTYITLDFISSNISILHEYWFPF